MRDIIEGLVAMVVCVLILVGLYTGQSMQRSIDKEDAYRQGQIDAINGKVMYELKQLPTGETVWVKRKENNERPQ